MGRVAPDTSVTCGVGVVPGRTLPSGVRQFLGVPYAEPLERARVAAFEPPQQLSMLRPEMEAGTREVDRPYGGGMPELSLLLCPGCTCCVASSWCCRSTNESTDGTAAGLDVLRVSIWAPPPAAASAPVLVWIHGGGDAGSARLDDPNTRSGERLAQAQGVVVCAIDFRQGVFGTMDWGSGSDVRANQHPTHAHAHMRTRTYARTHAITLVRARARTHTLARTLISHAFLEFRCRGFVVLLRAGRQSKVPRFLGV